MAEPFVGQITLFAGNFAPSGWAFCNGQTILFAQNIPLYVVIGNTYGGTPNVNFNLPDLRGRVPVHPGNGPSLTPRVLGEKSGTESETLTTGQMPAHSHALMAKNAAGNVTNASGNVLANEAPKQTAVYSNQAGDASMGASIANAGSSLPHNNMPPFLAINFIIALDGIFPSQN